MTGAAKLTSDFSNDHPVSFAYTTTLATADGGLVAPSSLAKVDAAGLLPLYGGTGMLECATCHNVHGGTSPGKLLRLANTASALCITCHIK